MVDVITNGDARVNGVFAGEPSRWNGDSALGTAVTVTYSFPAAPLSYIASDASLVGGWRAFSADEQQVARSVLAYVASFTGITFQEVSANSQSYGQILFQFNNQTGSSGYAFYPVAAQYQALTPNSGDVYIANQGFSGFAVGNFSYSTLVHEIGHALGLKHPGNYNAGEADGASSTTGPFLDAAHDNNFYSIMSYTAVPQGQQNTTYATYDILALRAVYGARATHTDADVYSFTDTAGTFLQTLIDDGGTDTLDFSRITLGVTADINAGGFSSAGRLASGALADRNLSIAFDATIENVVGTDFADTILGNAVANILSGGSGKDTFTGAAGNDTINGGEGIDTAVYSGLRTAYSASISGTGTSVTGAEGSDSLVAVERLKFSDSILATDLSGNAGQTYRLYQAAFNRAPDLVGLSVNVKLEDQGLTLKQMANAFIASAEFKTLYGTNTANDAYIRLLYSNVLHREPDAAGAAGWAAVLADGSWDRESILYGFSESNENIAALQPAIASGILLDLGTFA